jgi:cation transport protein ChaC
MRLDPSSLAEARLQDPDGGLWVFAYGSLIWRPDFPHVARVPARLKGHHRALCVYSHVHRGTPERPGLVMGLDRGGTCQGVAYRVAGPDVEDTVAYLRAREQVTSVYLERLVPLALANGGRVRALGYVVDRAHRQYAGRLAPGAVLDLVRGARGQSGANPDYVLATHAALAALGVSDPMLAWLARELEAGAPEAGPARVAAG